MPGSRFRHNVSDPPERRYHQPGRGGRYAARIISVSDAGNETWLAWQGYEPDSGLDEVWCQKWDSSGRTTARRVTPEAGDHMRPVICASEITGIHVFWIEGQCRLMCAEVGNGSVSNPVVVFHSDGWLREPAVCRSGSGYRGIVIESINRRDRLILLQFPKDSDLSRPNITPHEMDGYTSRPDLLPMQNGEVVISCDVYESSQYHISILKFAGDQVVPVSRLDDDHAGCLQGRLSMDAAGTPWICYLCDKVLEREGVINRAVSVRVARYENGSWTSASPAENGDVIPLHQGLLPHQRYFGYAGLRRNPFLVPTQNGAVHLVWEQQRSEHEDWDNVWNGALLSMRWSCGEWDGPFRWHEGGNGFALDYRTLHDSNAVACFAKGPHRELGDDFIRTMVDPDAAPRAPAHTTAPQAGWDLHTPGKQSRVHPESTVAKTKYRLYFGDFHNHSVFSPDAEGHPDELYHFARDVAEIDFAGITDNDFYPEKALLTGESSFQRRLAKRLHDPGTFLPFTGFEWTFHRDDGRDSFNHRSIIYLGEENRLVRRIESEGATEDDFREAISSMHVLAHAHHAEYQLLGIPQEANVEITSGWAINMELSERAHGQLLQGFRFGFSAASDSHRAVPGLGGALVGVWAKNLTREAIAEAMQARRCFATTGNRPIIEFAIGDTFIGGVARLRDDEPVPIQVRVQSDIALKRVSLIRNGTVLHEFECAGRSLDTSWSDTTPREATAWYYLRIEEDRPYQSHPHNICQAVGHLAWSSPIWVERR